MERKTNKSIKVFLLFCLSLSLFSTLFLTKPNTNVAAQEPTPTPEIEPRIVGGNPATPGQYPWQVAIIGSDSDDEFYYGDGYQFCGGSLIHPYWVLTAAHCVTENNGTQSLASSIDIVAGLYDLHDPVPGYQRKDVEQIIRHPSYNDNNLTNDIALIKLTSPVAIQNSGETSTALINLAPPSIGALVDFEPAWVSGWGKISVDPLEYPFELHHVDLKIISNSACAAFWGTINDSELCAGESDGRDSCSGDSGGPLAIQQGGKWILVGIVSSGVADCGTAPGIYTRVSYYHSWVYTYVPRAEVQSITRINSNPTNAATISFNVTFYDDVVNVDATDFALTTTGNISGASLGDVSGSGSSYTVTVNTGSGSGSIRLDLIDNDSILDSFSIPLGGTGTGNGNFTSGEEYTIDKTAPTVNTIECVNSCASNMLSVSYIVLSLFPKMSRV